MLCRPTKNKKTMQTIGWVKIFIGVKIEKKWLEVD
jgi:hypothetical protein